MSNRTTSEATNWAASAVRQAIEDSGRTKVSIAERTGIPYPTLNRKLAGLSELSLVELLLLADALDVHPSEFVPPAMRPSESAA